MDARFQPARPGRVIVDNAYTHHHCLDIDVLDELYNLGVRDRRSRLLVIKAALAVEGILNRLRLVK